MRPKEEIKSEIEEILDVLESGVDSEGSDISINTQVVLINKLEGLQRELRKES